jgi:HSP20 family protein
MTVSGKWIKVTFLRFHSYQEHNPDGAAIRGINSGGMDMARRYRRSIFDELEDMRAYMDSLFQQMFEPGRMALLPAGEPADLVPAYRSELRVDVIEQGDEVVVTADMIPGINKEDIALDLLNPTALAVSCEREEERKEEKEGYYLRERSFGSTRRVIPLPQAVTDDGATATFKNGVLEVHLKKAKTGPKAKIIIQ